MSVTINRPLQLDADFVDQFQTLLQKKGETAPGEIESLRQQLSDAEGKRDTLRQSFEALKTDRDHLTGEVQALRQQLSDAEGKRVTLCQSFEALKTDRDHWTGEVQALRQQLSDAEGKRDKPREEPVPSLEEAAIRQTLVERDKEIEKLESEKIELKERLKNAQYETFLAKQRLKHPE